MHPRLPMDTDDRVLLVDGDSVDPYLFLRARRRQTLAEPELKLVFAVLEDALDLFAKYLRTGGRKGRAVYRETEEWIFCRKDDRIFSFSSVCEILGIDPDYLRAGVRRWKANFAVASKGLVARPIRLRVRSRVVSSTAVRASRETRKQSSFRSGGRHTETLPRRA